MDSIRRQLLNLWLPVLSSIDKSLPRNVIETSKWEKLRQRVKGWKPRDRSVSKIQTTDPSFRYKLWGVIPRYPLVAAIDTFFASNDLFPVVKGGVIGISTTKEEIMRRLIIVLTVILFAFSMASAQERPSPDQVRKVIDYYYHGKGSGAVLMDLQICEKVGLEEGPKKNECLDTFNPGQIPLDGELYLWMNFLIPIDDSADIIVTFSRNGKVRKTASVKLAGATRFRTWKRIPTNKAGQWSISILQELEDKDLELGGMQYTVVKPTQ